MTHYAFDVDGVTCYTLLIDITDGCCNFNVYSLLITLRMENPRSHYEILRMEIYICLFFVSKS